MAEKIWNPRKKTHWSRNDHTPLADAIMTGNVEIVKKAIMPYIQKLQPIRKDSVLEAVWLLSSMVNLKSSKFYYNIHKAKVLIGRN